MRALISKLVIGTMVAGAALAVSACGDKTETTTDNTLVTDMNAMDDMDMGTMTDNMTAVDGTMGNDVMMANDLMANDTLANDTAADDTVANEM